MKDKMQTITLTSVYMFFFCYFMRFFNFPNMLVVILGGGLCLLMVIQEKQIRINLGIILLVLTLASYYVICDGIRGLLFSILYIPLVVYVLADYISNKIKGNNEKILLLIMMLVLGYAIHGILNSYMWYAGYVVPGTRRWQDFWSREIVPGTQHAAYYLPMLALLFPAIAYFKKNKWINLAVFICSLFFGYTALVTKSRMQLVICLLVFLLQLVAYILLERETIRKNLTNKKVWLLGVLIIAVAVTGIILAKDSEVVVAFLENMSKGGGIVNNIRFQAQRLALGQLFVYPMGGRLMEFGEISHAHNVWLDMANAAGLIPFFAFTAYTIYTLYELIRFFIKKEIPSEIKIIILGLYVTFFLYFTVEPALEASIHLMTPWFFVNGLVHGKVARKDH